MAVKINIIAFSLHPTNGFFPGYSNFPIHSMGCLELEAFFLLSVPFNRLCVWVMFCIFFLSFFFSFFFS